MRKMFLDIEKAQKLFELTRKSANLKKKRAAVGKQMKSSPI